MQLTVITANEFTGSYSNLCPSDPFCLVHLTKREYCIEMLDSKFASSGCLVIPRLVFGIVVPAVIKVSRIKCYTILPSLPNTTSNYDGPTKTFSLGCVQIFEIKRYYSTC